MIEKVNPSHPDKVADRIAGAIVDKAYSIKKNPKVAVEVLIGHGKVYIINETDTAIPTDFIEAAVARIAGPRLRLEYVEVPQDVELSNNQKGALRAGDNGIFRGVPIDSEVRELSEIAREIYKHKPSDGKYILDKTAGRLIICQSGAMNDEIKKIVGDAYTTVINPLGEWTGGTSVDTGATNRKLGSDMGRAVTGGGLHGKDLSKADVAVNIYAHLKAKELGKEVNICCAIGNETVDGRPYQEIVDRARAYIEEIGGFERLAEWGIV